MDVTCRRPARNLLPQFLVDVARRWRKADDADGVDVDLHDGAYGPLSDFDGVGWGGGGWADWYGGVGGWACGDECGAGGGEDAGLALVV